MSAAALRRLPRRLRLHGRLRGRRATSLLAVWLLVALTALAALPATAAADDPPVIKVDPATQSVAPGQQFTVNVVQSATIETSGIQLNLSFDPKLLQLKDFGLGKAFTSANAIFAFGNADLGTSGNKPAVLTRANKFGTLENVSGFLLPGSGSIPAGDTVFLTLTFAAQPGAGGDVHIGLQRASILDGRAATLGQPLADPVLQAGTVTVGEGGVAASGSPGASGVPGSSGDLPSAEATVTPTEPAPAPSSPTTPVSVRVAPTSLTLKAGDQARIFLIANADGDISSIAADLSFDATKLQILSIDPGMVWDGATVIAAATDPSASGGPSGATGAGGVPAAIDAANKSGVLFSAGVFLPPGTQAYPYGEAVFVSVLVKATADATTPISIANAEVIGVAGEAIPSTVEASSLTKPKDKGIQLDLTLVIPLVLLAVLAIGFAAAWRTGRIPVRVRRRWPYYLTLLLGLIPVLMFAGIVLMLVAQSLPVVNDPGLPALFGAPVLDAAGQPITRYSLVPALWGTVLITVIAVAIALPIALVLAIVAVDFPMGPIGRLVRPVIGILSGVPPIVYAVSVPAFITAFMIPKFAANMSFSDFQNGGPAAIGADPATWPPAHVPYSAGGFPWSPTDPSSALLGGLLVALFLIPFVTPLFVDALRDVPRAGREASLALGANRTYTLRRVVLPRALPAMAGAATLAVLKAMGDAVIVLFAVGFEAVFPTPPLDVLERAAPIGSWGSNLIGSFETLDAVCKPADCAVGYTSALFLLLVAAALVVVFTSLQARSRRRLAV